MDQDKISQFISHYRSLVGDELTELYEHRENLVEEAIFALEKVLSEKGVNKDILERYSAKTLEIENTPSQDKLSRQLSNGMLARACKAVFMIDAWSPVYFAFNRLDITLGPLWVGLLAFGLGYGGYRIGGLVTGSICAIESTTFSEKKRHLWFLLLAAIVMYFALIFIVSVIFPMAS